MKSDCPFEDDPKPCYMCSNSDGCSVLQEVYLFYMKKIVSKDITVEDAKKEIGKRFSNTGGFYDKQFLKEK